MHTFHECGANAAECQRMADKASDPAGFVNGLKYYISPASYARLAAAVGNPLTATDAQVEPAALLEQGAQP